MPAYTPILATLGYVLSPDGAHVLLVHRNARADDPAYGKFNGLGGKLEPDEDVATGMRRELREEADIEVHAMTLRGTISWPGFGKGGEDWFGFVFVVPGWSGSPPPGNQEGTLEWVPVAKLLALELDLWPGDRHFLPLVFDADPRPFHGVMPYAGGQPVSWHVTRL
uniref:Mutator MutT protein (7,8-dihydro-8-oxoguanine-triphosphatase) n=1 Tax=uncultured Armatimonadetes bacterium TaxID=157466 RepID=A0A6J4KA51_9BACT|nr:Mutator MutT protein (7,8-dihydro-8-oxoguanine-triphosphatase) [uncultured Armatimonadetes bacterium]